MKRAERKQEDMKTEDKNMPSRRKTRQVRVGNVKIGGGAPVSIQSMLNTPTVDVDACVAQINELTDAGCDLVRLAVPNEASAEAFGTIAKRTGLPLIADIHYSYKLAHMALDAGAKKIRMNPGNMRDFSEIKYLAKRMADAGVPVRVGVNGGSLDPKFDGMDESDALVESALECANVFESCGMRDIVLAIKASDVMTMVRANRKAAAACDFPLHLGVTEAGTLRSGLVKSSIGIGMLLGEGIGDTVRVSLSAPPVEEVLAAKTLLRSLGLKKDCAEVVSCPTCARTEIDVEGLASAVERATAHVRLPLKIAVMGCPLNGIGEGKNSDLAIAGGKDKSVILRDGEIVAKVPGEMVLPLFMSMLDDYIADYSKNSQKR